MRVPFVDDEPLLLRSFARAFRKRFDVIIMDSPEHALEALPSELDVDV